MASESENKHFVITTKSLIIDDDDVVYSKFRRKMFDDYKDRWTHVIFSIEPNKFTIYINGKFLEENDKDDVSINPKENGINIGNE